jgi:hypothetical protein
MHDMDPVTAVARQAAAFLFPLIRSIGDGLIGSARARSSPFSFPLKPALRSRDWGGNMRSVSLLRLALEAEILRLRHLLQRQARRAAFGLVAAIFAVSVLVLANVAGWQALRLYVASIYATLILLGVNLVVTVVFALFVGALIAEPRRARGVAHPARSVGGRAKLAGIDRGTPGHRRPDRRPTATEREMAAARPYLAAIAEIGG